MQTDVFKFVALRPPKTADPTKPGNVPIKDPRPPQETPIGRLVREVEGSLERALPLVRRWVEQTGATPQLPDVGDYGFLPGLVRYLRAQEEKFDAKGFPAGVEAALKMTPAALAGSGHLRKLQAGLWDRLMAFYVIGRAEPTNLEDLIEGIRALAVVDLMAAGRTIDDAATLNAQMAATVVLPEPVVRMPRIKPAANPRTDAVQAADDEAKKRYAGLWRQYVDAHQALEEIRTLPVRAEAVRPPSPDGGGGTGRSDSGLRRTTFAVQPTARPEALRRLSPVANEHLSAAGTLGGVNRPGAVERLNRQLTFLSRQLFSTSDPRLAQTMPEEALSLPGGLALRERLLYRPEFTKVGPTIPFPFPWVLKPTVRPLGIGDLKVVKQTLEKYLAGEVAHIENVLKGESKDRKFRTFDRTEQTITTSVETTEETEKDNQTTDRFELKKESEKTIQTDLSISAGINVTASYGPVSLGAYANFAYSNSEKDSTKSSSNFARDVVDKSVSRIQKKTFEQRVTTTIHEVEEIDDHGLNNVGGSDHITGVYRWVDKHYKAQVYNYGKRMMFEFVVPEPAAFYVYAQEHDPAKQVDVEQPKPLGSVTHKDITEYNYQNYVRDYNVQGTSPPPPPYKMIGLALDQSGMQNGATSSKSNRELVVPDGYTADSYGSRGSYTHWDNSAMFVGIGQTTLDDPGSTLSGEDSVVPIAIETSNVAAYAITFEVECQRTARAYEVWQLQTYEKIAAAYQSALAQYQDKLKAAQTARGIVISGHNPGINRQVEKTELKKLSLSLLTGEDYSRFNAVSGAPPEVDWLEATSEGKFIQFFEQAFEWEQITYLYYPYFWGRKPNWPTTSNTYDEDPLFTQFLQAGAARVVVPVRPAYNDAILYYLETGDLWNGGDAPHLNDPLYVSIVEELKDQQDDLGNAVPEGDPWEVVLPTTLVYLQKGPELPDFTV